MAKDYNQEKSDPVSSAVWFIIAMFYQFTVYIDDTIERTIHNLFGITINFPWYLSLIIAIIIAITIIALVFNIFIFLFCFIKRWFENFVAQD